MRTWTYLFERGDLYWPGLVAGLCIAAACAGLSVLVALKRLSFIGQGISHAAFGGVGLLAALGLAGTAGVASSAGTLAQYAIIFCFCLAAALMVGLISGGRRRNSHADTAIGVVLVASMAAGSILSTRSRSGVAWESFLFGSLLNTTWTDAAIAGVVGAVILATLWAVRRPLLFWAFDEHSARAFGVDCRRVSLILLVLLTMATVLAMKLAGVVLATAMLVLPGASALNLSARGLRVLALSLAIAVAGVVGGIILSFEADWLPGASIVAMLTILYGLALGVRALRPEPA
jgi:ABC-type Mn2+/Zn2+ transport system permease subunit